MKSVLLFSFLLLSLTTCISDEKSPKKFNSIEFSYFDTSPEKFSLRVLRQDSVFVKQSVSSNSQEKLKDGSIYVSLLRGDLKQQFESLITNIDFEKFDSVYETGHTDGDEYKIYIEGEATTKQIYVHSTKPPKQLDSLKNIFMNIKRTLIFVPTDATINFK